VAKLSAGAYLPGLADKVDPLFNRHEFEQTSLSYARREACNVLLTDLIHLAEGVLVLHVREQRLRFLVRDSTWFFDWQQLY
jgi:hypothetical protein